MFKTQTRDTNPSHASKLVLKKLIFNRPKHWMFMCGRWCSSYSMWETFLMAMWLFQFSLRESNSSLNGAGECVFELRLARNIYLDKLDKSIILVHSAPNKASAILPKFFSFLQLCWNQCPGFESWVLWG